MIRKIAPLWMWGITFLLLLILTIGTSVAANYYVTIHQIRNECDALNLLTSQTVPKPADPKANPSRELNYKFYVDLLHWKDSDGC